MKKLKVDYELVGFSEIDKYAIKSYCAIHNVNPDLNLGDITKINEIRLPKNIDLLTYGFPCQDISVAGKLKGFQDENGEVTRSGLFFEALRIIEKTKPKIAIAENVKNLTSKKFSKQFETVLTGLENAGYKNYWRVLNAKDYAIPQNRERVFIVSIRKDIDNGLFEFPQPIELKLRLKDLLEDEVEEKYYIKTDKANELIKMLIANGQLNAEIQTCDGSINSPKVKDISNCIIARYDGGISNQKSMNMCVVKAVRIGGIYDKNGKKHQAGSVWDCENISPTIDTAQGGNRQPMIIKNPTPNCLNSKGGRAGIEGLQPSVQDRIYDTNSVSVAMKTSFRPSYIDGFRIRKLTPKECWRLMGFDDEDFEKAEQVNSNTQLYKQAGNSIVVNVLEFLLKRIFNVLNERN